MIRARLLVCIAGALGVTPRLAAQSPRLESRVPAPVLAAVTPIIDSARAAGLPIAPLEQKVLEGVTKQADPSRIAAAVRRLAGELAVARAALGERATVRELVAGAGALRAGLTRGDLAGVRTARGDHDIAVALEVTTDLISSGVPTDTATRAVVSVLKTGASDHDLEQLRTGVERDVAGGMAAGVAASLRARVLGGSDATPPPKPH